MWMPLSDILLAKLKIILIILEQYSSRGLLQAAWCTVL